MANLEIDPAEFKGLHWSGLPDLPCKLGRAALWTPEKAHEIVDFDATMTTAALDSWGVMSGLQNEAGREKYLALKEENYPIHQSGRMTDSHAASWWEQV